MEEAVGLVALGLHPGEERLYRQLVALGAAPAEELARVCGQPVVETETDLRALEQRGLVALAPAPSPAGGWRWVAAPPGVALRALVNQRRHELEQAEVAAAHLGEQYRTATEAADARDHVEVVTGAAAVGQRFLQLQLGAVREVCALVTDRPVAVSSDDNDAEETAATRGVAYRIVLEEPVLELPGSLAAIGAVLRREEQVRVTPRVPTKLVMADREVAMVPLSAEATEPAAVIVRGSGLLGALAALFEATWRAAVPLRLTGTEEVVEAAPVGPTTLDLQILSLLLAGVTDATIAKQLGLGLRTVQRRVSVLHELAGATTRMQLGWVAHERGWVTRS